MTSSSEGFDEGDIDAGIYYKNSSDKISQIWTSTTNEDCQKVVYEIESVEGSTIEARRLDEGSGSDPSVLQFDASNNNLIGEISTNPATDSSYKFTFAAESISDIPVDPKNCPIGD